MTKLKTSTDESPATTWTMTQQPCSRAHLSTSNGAFLSIFDKYRYPPYHRHGAQCEHPRPFSKTSIFFRALEDKAWAEFCRGRKDRRSSHPLVTGDGFRSVSLFVFDETTYSAKANITKLKVALHDITTNVYNAPVFVATGFLDTFIRELYDSIVRPIVLVTHNSDYSAPYERGNTRLKAGRVGQYHDQTRNVLRRPDKVSLWYAANAAIVDERLVALPLGIENRYNRYGRHTEIYEKLSRSTSNQTPHNFIFVSFNIKTNPQDRKAALKMAYQLNKRSKKAITFYDGFPSKKTDYLLTLTAFLKSLQSHSYFIAPHGHGLDTHRLWEGLSLHRVGISSLGSGSGANNHRDFSEAKASYLTKLDIEVIRDWETFFFTPAIMPHLHPGYVDYYTYFFSHTAPPRQTALFAIRTPLGIVIPYGLALPPSLLRGRQYLIIHHNNSRDANLSETRLHVIDNLSLLTGLDILLMQCNVVLADAAYEGLALLDTSLILNRRPSDVPSPLNMSYWEQLLLSRIRID